MMLPSFRYLDIVSVLDEALIEYIDFQKIPWPKKKKQDLYNRINVVSNYLSTLDAVQLQSIRERRNSVAHEPSLVLTNPITWDEYNLAVDCICFSMREMGFIKDIPNVTAFFQRNPTLFLEELGPDGEIIKHEFVVGAKLDEHVFMELKQAVSYFPPT